MKATITQMEWVKDENGNQVYEGLDKFRAKLRKQAERQNKKVAEAHTKGRMLSFSILNVEDYVEMMVKMYGHQFRATRPGRVLSTTSI
jgi:FKBP-type peptidyl-prolyl cis-trans isomerase (trigger factor)